MRVVKVGPDLPSGVLQLKYNSANVFSFQLWNDEDATDDTDLTGFTGSIEVKQSGTTVATWPLSIAGNTLTATLTSTDTNVTWRNATFQVLLNPGRNVILSGTVAIQK